jgi:hypothetical protein
MSINISTRVTKLPGVKLELTVDFSLMTKRQRTGILTSLKHCRHVYTNPITNLLFSATDVPLHTLNWGHTRIAMDLFDTPEAQDALNVYLTHMALIEPDTTSLVQSWYRDDTRQYVTVMSKHYRVLNMYEVSPKYRAMVEPLVNAVLGGETITLRLREQRS